jgi:hypothetical protein
MNIQMSLHAEPKYLIATDIAAFLLSVAVLFAVFRIRLLLSPLAFALLVIVMAAGFGVDIARWFARGIRVVEIDDDRLTLYSGVSMKIRAFDRAAVKRSRVRRGIGRRIVIVKPRVGRSVRIREETFPREEFARFAVFIRDWC